MKLDTFDSISMEELFSAAGWQARYRIIMEWSKYVSEKPELRTDEYAVPGCDAAVWLKYELAGDVHYFYFDSDSRIIKGLVVIILAHVQERKSCELDFTELEKTINEAGFQRHLSASRANGFTRIYEKIKMQIYSVSNC